LRSKEKNGENQKIVFYKMAINVKEGINISKKSRDLHGEAV